MTRHPRSFIPVHSPVDWRERGGSGGEEERGGSSGVRTLDQAGGSLAGNDASKTSAPGPTVIEWDLRDESGVRVRSALYMVRIQLGNGIKNYPLVVVR